MELELLMMTSTISITIFLFSAVIAEIVGTIAGFGSATILVPIAGSLFDIKRAIGLVALFHFFGQLVDGFLWRKFIMWRIGILFSVAGVILAFVGASLIVYLPGRSIEIALGVFLVTYAVYSLAGRKFVIPTTNAAIVVAGGITGFVAGLIGIPGALRTAFLSSLNLKREYFLGTSFAVAFLVDIVRVGVYFNSGTLELNPYWWMAIFVVAFFGSLIGKKLITKIESAQFYLVVYCALLLFGIKLLFW